MNTAKDYYAILGVLPTAEDFVIEAAYRALTKHYHPDRYNGTDAHGKILAINEAFEVLGNTSKRKQYDQRRKTDPGISDLSNRKPNSTRNRNYTYPRNRTQINEKKEETQSSSGMWIGFVIFGLWCLFLMYYAGKQ